MIVEMETFSIRHSLKQRLPYTVWLGNTGEVHPLGLGVRSELELGYQQIKFEA